MTRQEAIQWIKQSPFYHSKHEPFNMAIKALEQEPCEDCVSRKRLMDNYNGIETPVGYRKVVDMDIVKSLPSVQPTRIHAQWEYLKHDKAKCSNCEDVVLIAQQYGSANYCPNCGADMRGGENENT